MKFRSFTNLGIFPILILLLAVDFCPFNSVQDTWADSKPDPLFIIKNKNLDYDIVCCFLKLTEDMAKCHTNSKIYGSYLLKDVDKILFGFGGQSFEALDLNDDVKGLINAVSVEKEGLDPPNKYAYCEAQLKTRGLPFIHSQKVTAEERLQSRAAAEKAKRNFSSRSSDASIPNNYAVKWSNETVYANREKCMDARKKWEITVKEEKGMMCRNVLGAVIVCDNVLEHVEFGCRGDKQNILWIEVFDQ